MEFIHFYALKISQKTWEITFHSRWKASPGLKSGAGEEFFRFSGPISDIQSGFCAIRKSTGSSYFLLHK